MVGLPLAVEDGSLWHAGALVGGDPDLALGDGAGGDVEDDRRAAGNRHSRGDRVGRQPALLAAVGRDEDAAAAGVHEVERDLALPGGHLGPVADPAQVAGIPQRHQRHAELGALVEGELHRLLADHLAESEPAVEHGHDLVLARRSRPSGWARAAPRATARRTWGPG